MTEDEAAAAALAAGLTLDEISLQAVVANLRLLAARAEEFTGIELPDALDPLPLLRL
jgi:hypothetical protein